MSYFAGRAQEIYFRYLSLSFEVCTGIILWTKLMGIHMEGSFNLFPPNHPSLFVGDVGQNPGEAACCGGPLVLIKMTKLLFCPHFLLQELWYPRVKMVQKEIRKNEVTYSSYLKTCQVKPIALTNKVTTKF